MDQNTTNMSNMLLLRKAIHNLYETDPEDESRTKIMYAGGGSYENGLQHATYQGSAVDCDGDEVPFVVQWIYTEHYEVCTLYTGADMAMLWSDGTCLSSIFTDEAEQDAQARLRG